MGKKAASALSIRLVMPQQVLCLWDALVVIHRAGCGHMCNIKFKHTERSGAAASFRV